MHGPGAAESRQRKASWIVAALDRDDANGLFHVGIHHLDDAGGKLIHGEAASVLLEPLLRDGLRALDVELEVAAEKLVCGEASQQEIGIGHRGALALAIADGTGIGAGGFRSHAQRAAQIEAGQRASARADGVDVKNGHAYRKPGNVGLVRGRGTAINQRHVGRGPTHVEGDDALAAAAASDRRRAHHAARGTGEHRAHRLLGGGVQRRDAAARLHDEDARRFAFRAPLAHAPPQTLQIVFHRRLQVGIYQDCAGALVFAKLRQNQVRNREWGPQSAQLLRHRLLVHGVGEGEQ